MRKQGDTNSTMLQTTHANGFVPQRVSSHDRQRFKTQRIQTLQLGLIFALGERKKTRCMQRVPRLRIVIGWKRKVALQTGAKMIARGQLQNTLTHGGRPERGKGEIGQLGRIRRSDRGEMESIQRERENNPQAHKKRTGAMTESCEAIRRFCAQARTRRSMRRANPWQALVPNAQKQINAVLVAIARRLQQNLAIRFAIGDSKLWINAIRVERWINCFQKRLGQIKVNEGRTCADEDEGGARLRNVSDRYTPDRKATRSPAMSRMPLRPRKCKFGQRVPELSSALSSGAVCGSSPHKKYVGMGTAAAPLRNGCKSSFVGPKNCPTQKSAANGPCVLFSAPILVNSAPWRPHTSPLTRLWHSEFEFQQPAVKGDSI